MNLNKITLVAIFSLFILLGGRYTAAQAPQWSKANSAARGSQPARRIRPGADIL